MRFLIFLIPVFFLSAQNLEITANSFYHKDGEKKAVFNGNVIAKEGDSFIKADKITVYLDENSEAKEYVAEGNVYFEIKDKKKFIKGTSKKIKYVPIEDKYYLSGNVILEDVLNKRKVYGETIVLDNKTGSSYAKSKNKPVKFIFKVKSKK
jgi:lipopolysaccharide export system protein LptA